MFAYISGQVSELQNASGDVVSEVPAGAQRKKGFSNPYAPNVHEYLLENYLLPAANEARENATENGDENCGLPERRYSY